ncbi:hypothetical protein ACJJIQ_19510 [Microbulbifer sp. ANSA003]|uniref:hypothetical protein n=1 Tax=Microbulbifer sp. ANSA003 TaxID=3243360 RepID=UPI00404394BA
MRKKGASPPFFQLYHRLLDLPAYIALPHPAKSLLMDMARQYNGRNNGDFSVTLKVMGSRGWTSNSTLRRALKALIDVDLVMLTRQGGLNKCSLYAFTWLPIDECAGKLEVKHTAAPPIPLAMHSSIQNSQSR